MMVGALVWPVINVGMTDASTTRRPLHAANSETGIHDRHVVDAHLAGAARMLAPPRVTAEVSLPVQVALDLGSRQVLTHDVRPEGV